MFVRNTSLGLLAVWIGLLLGVSALPVVSAETSPASTVRAGKQVVFEFTLRLDDQIVLDTNVGGEPLSYVHGLQQLMPGLEKGLAGLRVGESKKVVVQPEEGYGPVDKLGSWNRRNSIFLLRADSTCLRQPKHQKSPVHFEGAGLAAVVMPPHPMVVCPG